MSVNKVILIGNVGKDPEVRYLDSNVAVANLTLATTERGYTMNNGTVVPDKTEWHNIVLWRGLAELAEKYVKKGSQIYVEGKIRTRSWEDKEGNKRYTTEIYADNMQLLGKRSENGNGNESQGTSGEQKTSVQTDNSFSNPENDNADDLPF
jgi:single-strand DNA-binding protein